MGYLKYTPYLYFIFAVFFIYEAVVQWNESEATPWLSLMVAGLAIFMFFFRKKYAKKMHDRNNQS